MGFPSIFRSEQELQRIRGGVKGNVQDARGEAERVADIATQFKQSAATHQEEARRRSADQHLKQQSNTQIGSASVLKLA